MKTFTGRIIDPLHLRLEDIDIRDAAHHLSNECRFNGASRFFYSVAQHSDYVVQELRRMGYHYACKYGLLHDGSEAFLRDIPRPVKHSPEFSEYRRLEAEDQALVYQRFGLDPLAVPACVHLADNAVLEREGIELMNERYGLCAPAPLMIERLTPEEAEARFLYTFRQLFLE